MKIHPHAVFLIAVAGLASGNATQAQCTSTWDTTIGNPGFANGYAAPIRGWNDGGGLRIYVGGSFENVAGSTAPRYLAAWNPATQTWAALGGGINAGFSNAFMTSIVPFNPGSGERLVAGGFFDNAGGVAQSASLAMWNPGSSAWENLGTNWTGNTRGSIWSMAVWNGRLYVGGGVVNTDPVTGLGYPIGGQHWGGMASWDGVSWQSHVTTMTGFSPYIGALQVFDDGSGEALYAGGRFNALDNVPGTAWLARWNGETWSSVGGGITPTSTNFGIEALVVYNDGSGPALHIAGYTFNAPGQGSCNVAKWNGQQWMRMGNWIGNSRITCMAAFDDGTGETLYIGGTGNAIGALNFFARLEGGAGGQWVSVDGGANTWLFGLGVVEDKLYLGGSFITVNGLPANRIAARTSCEEACYANCDGSTTPPILNVEDFTCFINEFAAASQLPHGQQLGHYANCDQSTTPPVLNVEDFTCFINKFAQGCP
jgi:trimeric autotransporter adhesin